MINKNQYFIGREFSKYEERIKFDKNQDGVISSLDELIYSVEAVIKDFSADYAPNQDLSTVVKPTISWSWAFTSTVPSFQDDERDNALGNLAAKGHAPSISLSITTTVTQID